MGYTIKYEPERFEEFRKRQLNNSDWIKELSEEELDSRLAELGCAPYNTGLPLFKRQKAMLVLCCMESNYILWADPGTGKSRTALEIIRYRKKQDSRPALFLVPDLGNIQSIVDECNKYTPDLLPVPLLGSTEERLKILGCVKGDVYIINYIGLQYLLSRATTNGSIQIDPDLVKIFAKDFSVIIYDEIYNCHERSSINFQVGKELSSIIPYRYGMTGTPINRDLLALWSQFYLIDLGITLSKFITHFRQAFFRPKQERFGVVWKPVAKYKEDLFRLVKNKTIRYSNDALPERIHKKISITMSDSARDCYTHLKSELIEELKSDDWKDRVKNKFTKFRQICSGFLYVENKEVDWETGEEELISREEIVFENAKEPALEKLLLSPDLKDKKIIIFHDFTPSGSRICSVLEKLNIPYKWLYGKTKDKGASIHEFQTNKDCRVFVVNTKSGSIGLNLQQATVEIWYEPPISGITLVQGIRRIHRTGQTQTTHIYHFVVENSIEDKRIMGLLEDAVRLSDQMVDGNLDETKLKKNFLEGLNKSDVLKSV